MVTVCLAMDEEDGCHIEMPGIRGICCPNKTGNTYRANTRSAQSPYGYNQEETIKAIWASDKVR